MNIFFDFSKKKKRFHFLLYLKLYKINFYLIYIINYTNSLLCIKSLTFYLFNYLFFYWFYKNENKIYLLKKIYLTEIKTFKKKKK